MSSITNTGTTGTLSVLNNTGIRVGLNGEFTASVAANAVALQNTALNGNINITTNKGGSQTSAIFINGATGACIVLAQSALFALAFVFGPKHGLIANRKRLA
jgi:hypothetical protein